MKPLLPQHPMLSTNTQILLSRLYKQQGLALGCSDKGGTSVFRLRTNKTSKSMKTTMVMSNTRVVRGVKQRRQVSRHRWRIPCGLRSDPRGTLKRIGDGIGRHYERLFPGVARMSSAVYSSVRTQ